MALDPPGLNTFNHFCASHPSESIYMTRVAINSRLLLRTAPLVSPPHVALPRVVGCVEAPGGVELPGGPPFLPTGMQTQITGTETAPSSYDAIGRQWFAGIEAEF
jgi:hypothetical protein